MKNWINDERVSIANNKQIIPTVNKIDGIVLPYEDNLTGLNKWERQSEKLHVSKEYQDLFKEFQSYFNSEMNSIGDSSLSKETEILNKLSSYEK